jgi:hypothetical protein
MRTITALAMIAMTIAPTWSAPRQQQQAVFDPPTCVSGADTYCQPISKGPPPANIPQ